MIAAEEEAERTLTETLTLLHHDLTAIQMHLPRGIETRTLRTGIVTEVATAINGVPGAEVLIVIGGKGCRIGSAICIGVGDPRFCDAEIIFAEASSHMMRIGSVQESWTPHMAIWHQRCIIGQVPRCSLATQQQTWESSPKRPFSNFASVGLQPTQNGREAQGFGSPVTAT